MRERRFGLIRGLTDLLYPRRCPVCHGIPPGGRLMCPECRARLPFIEGPRCRKCGKPEEEGRMICGDCMRMKHLYVQGAGVFLYDDLMRETVAFFKYRGRREYGRPLGLLMLESCRSLIASWHIHAIMPVPVHAARLASRGFNQAELLSEPLSEGTGIPLETGALVRCTDTKAQKKLGAEERRKNLAGAFACTARTIPDRILLVDDIYTTGSTIDACSAALIGAGAEQVFFLTLCTGGSALT